MAEETKMTREERLAQALRANLARRKAQSRAQEAEGAQADEIKPSPPAPPRSQP